MSPDWNPTHTIPDGGLMARAEPNASLEPLQRIRSGTQVAVVEQRGGWSKIRVESGWEAWVDGTRLVAAGPAAPPPPPPPPAPAPSAEPEPAPTPAPEAPAAAAAGWNATHTVPDGGLPAREKPDASLDPLLRIRSGTGVRVLETSGAWSRIDIESGWQAWVDNRRLAPVGGTAPQPAATPEPQPATTAAAEPIEPTHTVPDKGLPTRDEPDSDAKTTGRLDGGTEVQLMKTDGLWARVRTAAGEEAWVNSRLLDEIGAAPAPSAEPEPAPTPAPEAPAAAAAGWNATHTVPDGGLPAREKPDASLDPLLRIRSGTGVRVLETSGAWSRIDIESGWQAWVDNRRLAPVGGTAPQPAATPEPQPATTAAAEPQAAAPEAEVWSPTHTIPDGGLSAWSEPKADRQPILKIKSGTEVRSVETRGAWTRIRTDSGWEAWVDGRRLVPIGG